MNYEPISETFTFIGWVTKGGGFTLSKKIYEKYEGPWRIDQWDGLTVRILSSDGIEEANWQPRVGENGSMFLTPHITDPEKITVELTCFADDRRIEMVIRRRKKRKEING